MSGRWSDYVISLGGVGDGPEELWTAAGGSGRCMYLLGVGFDPRSLVGIQRFLDAPREKPPIVGLVELPPPSQSSGSVARAFAADNQVAFERIVEAVELRVIPHRDVHSASNAGLRVAQALTSGGFLDDVDQLIIDISSLPAGLYLPLVAAALTGIDRHLPGFPSELQVMACENAAVDAAIQKLGVSEAAIVPGFRAMLDHDSDPHGTVIWAPVIGENSGPALAAIHDFLDPDDVCPVLPFPARNPRRADDLILEHQVTLLDTFLVTPSNIIYADERNPFDLYRTLAQLQLDYRLALDELKPTTLAVSTHSSKLLSVGAVLAAYEFGLPIVAAPALDYEVDEAALEGAEVHNVLTCAWLAGTPYQVPPVPEPQQAQSTQPTTADQEPKHDLG